MRNSRAPWIDRYRWERWIGCFLLLLGAGSHASAQGPDLPTTLLPVDPAAKMMPAESLEGTCSDGTGCQNAHGRYSILATLYISMIGKQPDPARTWTPLTFGNFCEGWCEPWIAPPSTTGGSLRQGWVGSNDAFFNRMLVGIYSVTNPVAPKQNEQIGTVLYETPITRRYMFGIFAPVVDSAQDMTGGRATAVGDIILENRFILHETKDTTVSFNLNVRVPTGAPELGAHRTSINPYVAFFQDIGCGFSLRGIVGADVPVDSRPDGVTTTLIGQFGIGQTLTKHDVPLFGDFTYYAVVNYRDSIGANDPNFVTITPGFRTHLGHNLWLLGGIDIPVTGSRPYQERFNVILVKGF